MRLPALWMMPLLLTVLVGCAPPKVALGASVSFGSGRAGPSAAGASRPARASVRNALWIALECSALAAADRAQEVRAEAWRADDTAAPCSLEAACDWEQAAARAAWLDQSLESEHEGEELP